MSSRLFRLPFCTSHRRICVSFSACARWTEPRANERRVRGRRAEVFSAVPYSMHRLQHGQDYGDYTITVEWVTEYRWVTQKCRDDSLDCALYNRHLLMGYRRFNAESPLSDDTMFACLFLPRSRRDIFHFISHPTGMQSNERWVISIKKSK